MDSLNKLNISHNKNLDHLSINTIRVLAADVVQKSNSGHPGAPMGCAPMAHALFSRFIRANPKNPKWLNRDRFVLSNGHACALQYILLHLMGYDLTMDDLKSFRQLNSKTPGHPENHLTPGIEVTTGPLGQGVSNAVGMAMAEAHLAARFNRPGYPVFDNYTFVILGDGCLQEGVSAEALSLAGHLKLGKLIALYDDNHVTIDGNTNVSFTEDVTMRFESYGWHTQYVPNGDSDLDAIIEAIKKAKEVVDKPSLIRIQTTIGFGSNKAGTDKVHGAALGTEDILHVKKIFGFDPEKHFFIPDTIKEYYHQFMKYGEACEAAWNELFAKYKTAHPELGAEIERRQSRMLPSNLRSLLPTYKPSDAGQATRKLSENVLNAIAEAFPELMGGSADLTGSNLTRWKTAVDFQHPETKLGTYSGRYIRFGVREHGMAAICNGMASTGMLFPFCSTFLNFISYALGAVRLSALSEFPVLYIMTHDSIGLGEDGPTHQPVETLASLRALPNLLTFRPADGNEVSGAYFAAFQHLTAPSVLALSRQVVPHLPGTSIHQVALGAYTLVEPSQPAHLTLVATGTEVSMAVDASTLLQSSKIHARVVSMPCCELFDRQPLDYKQKVFPAQLPILSIEALSVYGWEKYAHAHVGLTGFGASGPYLDVYKFCGITVEHVVAKAKKLLEFYKSTPVPNKMLRLD